MTQSLATGEITARQVKAARALLAWSQQDLADKAGLGVSTIADFERGQRNTAQNSCDAIWKALKCGGIKLLSGGAITGPMPSTTLNPNTSGHPIRWVDSTDIKQWADRRDCQDTLPELISKIIRAATLFSARICFPSKEGVQNPGWDGTCFASQGTAEIPTGPSGWELGTQRTSLTQKATDDYEKRTKEPEDIVPIESTFIFVTPRHMRGKKKWIKEKRERNEWADVRAYDADDLVHMLELYPAVGHWLAAHLGKRSSNIRQLEEVWKEWSYSTKWPMTSELVLASRDEQATTILRWLNGVPNVLPVQAESPEEAIAFLYAAIAQLPASFRDGHLTRCLVADNADQARFLGDSLSPLIIVLDDNKPGLAKQLSAKGHHVYVALGSSVGAPDEAVRLARPSRYELDRLLQDMGVPEKDAGSLAKDSARSLSVLRRLIPSACSSEVPPWALEDKARTLLAAMFVGSWDDRSPHDCLALEKLSGKKYEDYISDITPFLTLPDSPLRKAGTAWKIASPRDAWFRLAHMITKVDFDRFEEVAISILETPDPMFNIKPEDRWYSHKETGSSYSDLLRRGLTETLAVMSVYPERVTSFDLRRRPALLIRKLLEDATAERWWSLSSEIQNLAEIAPDELLVAIEKSLDESTPAIMELFKEADGVFGRAYHANLLWALEMLAWSPRYVMQVSIILARLAALDPGGKYSNRPMESLRSIYIPWLPQTSVSLNKRLLVLDKLRELVPDIAWKLILSLLPKGHDTLTPSPKPQWLDLPLDEQETVTYGLLRKGAEVTSEMLLSDVGTDVNRWKMLLTRYADFGPKQRDELIQKLKDVVVDGSDRDLRNMVWGSIRKILNHHRAYPDASWKMPEDDLKKLERIYKKLFPENEIEKVRWLFGSQSEMLPNPTGKGWKEDAAETSKQQKLAVKKIYAALGVNGIYDLARSAENPRIVGITFVRSHKKSCNLDGLLMRAFQSDEKAIVELAVGMTIGICERTEKNQDKWIASMLKHAKQDEWQESTIIEFLSILKPSEELWVCVDGLGPSVSESYWRTVSPYWVGDLGDVEFVIHKLLSVGRPHAALTLAGIKPKDVGSELLVQILDAVATTPPEHVDHNTGTMLQHHVVQLLKVLDDRENCEKSTLARLEWQYLSLLEHSQRSPQVLHKAMSDKPEFFVEILCVIYRPSEDSGIVEERDKSEDAKARATQAYRLLDSWEKPIPGQTEKGIDPTVLADWVILVRQLSKKLGRVEVADTQIGQMLAHAPQDKDGIWPPFAVRELLERVKSEDLERGLHIGVINCRGATCRSVGEGGAQERVLSAKYKSFAQADALIKYPRTIALLNQIADDYESQARWHDEQADRQQWD